MSVERRFELKLKDGREVAWTGRDGEDAARRYVDCMGGTVVAWREPPVQLVVGVDPRRIIG